MRKLIIPSVVILLTLVSCEFVSSLVHDDQLVAKVGKHKLYRSEVSRYLPAGVSPEDSVNLTRKYVNAWAAEILYAQVAEDQLSKQEKDVTQEIEEYTRSLIKFRYEQHYINDRLDTLITDAQIEEYYNAHSGMFTLQRPVMKVRFVDIQKDSPSLDRIEKRMGSRDPEDGMYLDSIARSSAIRYFDSSTEWMDASFLAKEFGVDYSTMLSKLEDRMIVFEAGDRDDVKMAYVFGIIYSGKAPLDFCSDQIRDMILSGRKHSLLVNLEQDLLDEALSHKKLVIY